VINKESLTTRQSICIIVLFVFGSSAIVGGEYGAEQDSWIAVILAIVMAIPLTLMYARIMKLYPNNDLFDISLKVFGNIAGRIIILLFVLYFILLSSLVLRNFSEFIQIGTLPETPQLAILVLFVLVAAYISSKGIQVLGKWCAVALPITASIVGMTIIFCMPAMRLSYIQPVFNTDIKTIFVVALKVLSFPFAEIVLFLPLASSVRKKDSPYKIYLLGLIFGGLMILASFLRNLLVLGAPHLKNSLFPSYSALRIVRIGTFLTRLDALITSNFYLGGFSKISACILASSIGVAKLFNVKDYKSTIIPICIIAVTVAIIIYRNVMEMFTSITIYNYYSFFFQLILPAIIWVGAEIKNRKMKAGLNPENQQDS